MGLLSERSEDDDEHGEISIAGLEHLDGDGDECVFDLADWSARGMALLRERLEVFGVPHRWEGPTSLVVAEVDEAWTERVLDQVEEELSHGLDPDVDQVAYDLTRWAPDDRDRLLDALDDEAVPHEMDDDELFVHAIDEDRVDELVEAIISPEESADASSGAPLDVMGELFVAADRLVHEPNDHGAVLELIDAVRLADGAPAPYGMDKVWWDAVVARATALTVLLDGAVVDDQAVVDAATELRDGLRPYV